jgi:hypothetical protein
MDFNETYNWFYIDQPNNNPSANVSEAEVGDIIVSGIAYVDTENKKFGNSSLYLNREGGAVVPYRTTDSSNIWTQDFTVESWLYLGKDAGSLYIVSDESVKRTASNWHLRTDGRRLYATVRHRGSVYTVRTAGGNIGKDEWHHVGFQRVGEYVYLLHNGSIVDVQPFPTPSSQQPSIIAHGNSSIYIGMYQSGNAPRQYSTSTNAWVDGVRVTKGVARYLEGGVTVPTASLTNDSDTLLLLNMERDYLDRGSFDLGIERQSGPAILTPYSPFSETGNVANSILTTNYNFYSSPHSAQYNLGTDFTVDFWMLRPKSVPGFVSVVTKPFALAIYFSTNIGYFSLGTNGTSYNVRNGSVGWPDVTQDTWAHYMMSREGNLVRFLKNGDIVNTAILSSSGALATNTSNLLVGSRNEFGEYSGYHVIHGLRINNGVSLGANTYDVPTVEYSIPGGDTSNVFLFATTANLETDGSNYGHTVVRKHSRGSTPVVNPTANTAGVPISPFTTFSEGYSLRVPNNRPKRIGTTSRYEPREYNMVYIPGTRLDSSTWTIEFHVKFATARFEPLYGHHSGYYISNTPNPLYLKAGEFSVYNYYSNPYFRWAQLAHKSNKLGIPRTSGQNITLPSTVPSNWNHFAIQNDGEFLKFWLNGILRYSFRTMMNVGAEDQYGRSLEWLNNGLWVGRPRDNSIIYYSDFIYHDFRHTDTAVYTANAFTPPSAPLTAIAGTQKLLFNSVNILDGAQPQGTDTSRPTVVRDSPYGSGTGDGSMMVINTVLRTAQVSGRDSNRVKGIGQGDFTFEGMILHHGPWVNPDVEGIFEFVPWSGPSLFLYARKVSGVFNIRIRYGVGNLPGGRSSYTEFFDVAVPEVRGRWFHWAISRKDGALTLYWDGKLVFAKGAVNCALDDGTVYFGCTSVVSTQLRGLIAQNRVSKVARYSSSYTVPTESFDLSTDAHASNVTLLANFDNQYYKYQPSHITTDSVQPNWSWGNRKTMNLEPGVHTLYTSAISFNRQNAIGWEILDPAGKIIFESRKDARDNNLGFLKHPSSSVRGFQITYSSSKTEAYQNALFGGPYTGLTPQKFILPQDIKGNQYDPKDLKFTVKRDTQKTIRTILPDKTVESTVITGNLALLSNYEYGTYYNCGFEGTQFVIQNKKAATYARLINCTFRYPPGALGRMKVLDKVKPAVSNTVVTYTGIGPGTSSGNLTITNGVFGLNKQDLDNAVRDPIQLNFFKKKPVSFQQPVANGGYSFPLIDDGVFGACIAANTFVITNDPLPALAVESLLTFSEFGTTINTNPGSTAKQPTNFTLANGAVTTSVVPTNVAATGSLLLPNTYPSVQYPTVNMQKSLLPAEADQWSLSFDMNHPEPLISTLTTFEQVLYLGDYEGRSRKYYYGRGLPNSLQITIRSAGIKVDRPTANPPVLYGNPRTYYYLRIFRRGSPWNGEFATLDLSPPAGLEYQLRTDTWYNIKLDWNGSRFAVFFDGVQVQSLDFLNERTWNPVPKYPEFDLKYNNQARTVIGKIQDFPLNSLSGGSLGHSNFRGYITNIRTTSGSPTQETQAGVYAGSYKWVL